MVSLWGPWISLVAPGSKIPPFSVGQSEVDQTGGSNTVGKNPWEEGIAAHSDIAWRIALDRRHAGWSMGL